MDERVELSASRSGGADRSSRPELEAGEWVPLEAALGALAGFSLWLGSWVLHLLWHPDTPVIGDPLFWMLGFAPFTLAGFGKLSRDHARVRAHVSGLEQERVEREAEHGLREALRRSLIVDSFDAVLVVGIGGVIHEANEAATNLFGFTAAELVQMRIGQILPEMPQQTTVHDLTVTPSHPSRIDWASRARHADGSLFPVEVHLSRVEPSVQVYTIRELSGQVLTTLAGLESGRKVLDHRRRSATLHSVVHALRARFGRLMDWIAESAREHRDVDPLVTLADDLAHDIDQLANVVMWDRADASPTIGPVNVRALLEQVVAELRPLPHLRHDRLAIEIDDGAVLDLVTDPSQISIVLRNVISHELRRLRDGTVSVEVLREAGRGSDWLTMVVHHVGREMSDDEVELIHEAFARSSDPHPTADRLLGLALGQRLARALGGHLAVESLPGQGTTLSLRIPTDPAKARAIPLRGPQPMRSPTPAPSRER